MWMQPKSSNTSSEVSSPVYDDAMVKQVRAFQAAHGLTRDGILSPATMAALNESVSPKSIVLSGRSIGRIYEDNRWQKSTPSTPFFDEIEYVVVNPKWLLPIGLFNDKSSANSKMI